MFKRIICALLCVIFAFFLIGCGTTMERADQQLRKPLSMFIIVEESSSDAYRIVYHRDTKVMYAISTGVYCGGAFTVMLNPDGSPMLWEGN